MKKFSEIVGILVEAFGKALRDGQYLSVLSCCIVLVCLMIAMGHSLRHEGMMAPQGFALKPGQEISEETKIEENLRCAEENLKKGYLSTAENCLDIAGSDFEKTETAKSSRYLRLFREINRRAYVILLSEAREEIAAKKDLEAFTSLYLAHWRAKNAGIINISELSLLEKEYDKNFPGK